MPKSPVGPSETAHGEEVVHTELGGCPLAQERSISLEELAPARNGTAEPGAAPCTSGRDIDGEELAIALASVANDVKVMHAAQRRAQRPCTAA